MNKLLIYFVSGLIFLGSISTIISSEKQNNYQILNEATNGFESYTIDINIEFGSFEIKNTNQGIDVVLEDFGQITTPGKPKLPYKIISIAIPPNTSPIKISYQNNSPIVLPGKYNVRAASSPNCTNNEIDNINFQEIFTNNYENTYFSKEPFPEKMVEFVRLSGYRNYNLIDLEINPFSYSPVSGILKFYSEVDITIEYEYISGQTTITNSESTRTKKIARDIIFNYDQAQEWYASSNNFTPGLHDFVIITLDSLTDAVEPLIQWETEKGRTVKVVTTSWIESNYDGYDNAGKIRNFLRDKYPDSEWG
ncbi:MAG: hypothetical protein KAJ21_04000, partial [Thermoplasmatales archaeon]|nr:hypothetical protein [Thermoplasmatales archaeon]